MWKLADHAAPVTGARAPLSGDPSLFAACNVVRGWWVKGPQKHGQRLAWAYHWLGAGTVRVLGSLRQVSSPLWRYAALGKVAQQT